tara:strand:+ start:65 stop:646 length:582 start_codon:yes stop_codon:yes gene_type:complete
MKGFSGFGNSPIKQKERKNWENYGKGEGADVVKKSGLGPRETPGYTDLETTKPGKLMAFDMMAWKKKRATKKMADEKVKKAYNTLKPKKKFGNSPLKKTDVYQYLDDGTKKKISYAEGVKKANQGTPNIRFTGKDLIKALETGALDEFNSPNQQEEVKQMIADEKAKLKGNLTKAEMKEASKPENTIHIKLKK